MTMYAFWVVAGFLTWLSLGYLSLCLKFSIWRKDTHWLYFYWKTMGASRLELDMVTTILFGPYKGLEVIAVALWKRRPIGFSFVGRHSLDQLINSF